MSENSTGHGLRSRARRQSTLTREAIEEVLYDKAYSWELVPGSDVMATTVGVLPKVGTHNSFAYYAGLVTYSGGALAARVDPGYWYLLPADTALTADAIRNATGYFAEEIAPAGVYLGVRQIDVTDPPPHAFPEGWTPGNTTGSGPVLPFIGQNGSYYAYAGLVEWDGTAFDTFGGTVVLRPAGHVLDGSVVSDPAGTQPPTTGPGLYLGVISVGGNPTPPTALPPGWTFRPYGLGPIAITDENAGGLIGDVAYVVSGCVLNSVDTLKVLASRNLGVLADGTYDVLAGDFCVPGNLGNCIVKVSGTLVLADGVQSGGTAQLEGTFGTRYWPFIERFDLAQKKWLPRIPLPVISRAYQGWPATQVDLSGPGSNVTHDGQSYHWTGSGDPHTTEPGTDEGTTWTSIDTPPAAPYATEGGIAGVIDGKLYFGGGDGDNITGQEFFVYDPADDSIARLADLSEMVETYGYGPDYMFYGVAGGRLYVLDADAGVWMYDPAHDAAGWTQLLETSVASGDQAQGFEIDGKLWFVYSGAAFVFDPVALTVTAKATGGQDGAPFLVDGDIQVFTGGDPNGSIPAGSTIYRHADDRWVARTDIAVPVKSNYDGEFVGVTHEGVPYLLTGERPLLWEIPLPDSYGHGAGVYGLTGVALDKPQPHRLDEADDAQAIVAALTQRALHPAGDVAWTPMTLLGSWVNFGVFRGAPRFRKDATGMVHLAGAIKNGGGDFFATLPLGYRPESWIDTTAVLLGGEATSTVVTIRSDGIMAVNDPGAEVGLILDGISFYAPDA